MPLTSDITISVSKFGPSAIPDQTNKFNEVLIEKLKGGPRWFEVCTNSFQRSAPYKCTLLISNKLGGCREISRNEKDWANNSACANRST